MSLGTHRYMNIEFYLRHDDFVQCYFLSCLKVNSVLASKTSFNRVGSINFLFLLIECLARLGLKPVFVSAVGSDPLGVMMLKHCEEVKMVRFCVLLTLLTILL